MHYFWKATGIIAYPNELEQRAEKCKKTAAAARRSIAAAAAGLFHTRRRSLRTSMLVVPVTEGAYGPLHLCGVLRNPSVWTIHIITRKWRCRNSSPGFVEHNNPTWLYNLIGQSR